MGNGGGNVHGVCILECSASIQKKLASALYSMLIVNLYLSGPSHRAPMYTDSSTKNMNQHLAYNHGVSKEFPDGASGLEQSHMAGQSRIEAAFGRTPLPGIRFNSDIFTAMLVQWIYVTNTPFFVVEDPTFRILLTYLVTCVSCSLIFISWINEVCLYKTIMRVTNRCL